METMQYKCPCCGGAIVFDSTVQNMKCPYCDTEFDVQTLINYDAHLQQTEGGSANWNAPGNTWTVDETTGLSHYVCSSCGGEIIGDATLAATSCPYCGNPVVLSHQFAGDLKPDTVIPFQLDKEAAKEALRNYYKGKKLLPKVFAQENHIDEIKGLYVPFWLFDATVDGRATFRAENEKRWSDSDYDYTKTSYYSVFRSGVLAFADVPVDGSARIDNSIMETLEPFDTSQAVPFQTAYLSGYFAERYDVNRDDCFTRAKSRMETTTHSELRSTVSGYDSVHDNGFSMDFTENRVRYALFPVWFLNTSWKDKQYHFALNGQTGQMAGDLPVDKGRWWKYFLLTWLIPAAALSGLVYLLGYLSWGTIAFAIIAPLIVSLIYTSVLRHKLNGVFSKNSAGLYEVDDSFNLTGESDSYLYSNTTRTPRPKRDDRN